MKSPILLHTTDSYSQFWDVWWNFFTKYVIDPPKVYFVTDSKFPTFKSDVEVIHTGSGKWGERLLNAMDQITEDRFYYMQEDFWAKKPFIIGVADDYYFNRFKMDALRICYKTRRFNTEPFYMKIERFTGYNMYYMTHHFSLWRKDFFRQFVSPTDDPWINEIEQSKRITEAEHRIFLIEEDWYDTCVTKGKLNKHGERRIKEL